MAKININRCDVCKREWEEGKKRMRVLHIPKIMKSDEYSTGTLEVCDECEKRIIDYTRIKINEIRLFIERLKKSWEKKTRFE